MQSTKETARGYNSWEPQAQRHSCSTQSNSSSRAASRRASYYEEMCGSHDVACEKSRIFATKMGPDQWPTITDLVNDSSSLVFCLTTVVEEKARAKKVQMLLLLRILCGALCCFVAGACSCVVLV